MPKLQQDKAKVQSLFEQSSAIIGTMSEKYLSNMDVKLSEVPEQYVRHLTLDDENGKVSKVLAIFMEDKQGEKIHCRVTHLNDHTQVNTTLKEPKAVLSAYDFRESFVPLQKGSQGSPIFYIQSIKEGLELKSKNIDGDIRATVYPGHLEQQSPENDRETWIVASQKTEATQKVAQRLDGYVLTFNKLLSTDMLEWKMEQEKIAVEEKLEAQKSAEMAASQATLGKDSVLDINDNAVSNTLEKSSDDTITPINKAIANDSLLERKPEKVSLQSAVEKSDHHLDLQDAKAIPSVKSSSVQQSPQHAQLPKHPTVTHQFILMPPKPFDKNIDRNQDRVMEKINYDYEYLKLGYEASNKKNKHILRDFQGEWHRDASSYLVAVGKDYSINHLIDYDSNIGREMKSKLEKNLKFALPDRCLAGLQEYYADQSNETIKTDPNTMTSLGENVHEITFEIASKALYLEKEPEAYVRGEPENKPVTVKDFQGIEHKDVNAYLLAVGKDRTAYDCINYDSAIGKKIKSVLESDLNMELPDRCVAGVKAIMQAHFGHNHGKIADLSPNEVMAEFEQKHDYLEVHWRNHMLDKAFGVKDFQGVVQSTPHKYLVSVGQDPEVYHKIDYTTEIAKTLKNSLEVHLERDLPDRCLVGLDEMQVSQALKSAQFIKESGLTQEKVMAEIQEKHDFLKANWQSHNRNDKDFGVTDFTGEKHRYPSNYLSAIGNDSNINPLVDYESKIGREIQQEMAHERGLDRDFGLEL